MCDRITMPNGLQFRADVPAMGTRRCCASGYCRRGRQKNVGEFACLRTVQIHINEIATGSAKDQSDVASLGKSLANVVRLELEILPVPKDRSLLAGGNGHRRKAATDVFTSSIAQDRKPSVACAELRGRTTANGQAIGHASNYSH